MVVLFANIVKLLTFYFPQEVALLDNVVKPLIFNDDHNVEHL